MTTRLSVCCMTSGRRPALLAAVLGSLREAADEIVVAVEEENRSETFAALADVADLVLAFPPLSPADRPIAWLFGACGGDWIFNIDDDEVPSPRLVAALPELVGRSDLTHAWVARRWLYPTPETYLDQPPWSTEFQLRLVLRDERFLQFSDEFHRPVVCHGPCLFVDAPLWHLDTALNPAVQRSAKARAYERERPGMRIGGLAHNSGMYVPELSGEPVLADVPEPDRDAVAAALAYRPVRSGAAPRATQRTVTAAEIDRSWPGSPYPEALYRAVLRVPSAPSTLTAGVQQTIDVHVTNESDLVWRWGKDARPEIRLAYRWSRGGVPTADSLRLRTPLPADLAPGESQLVPVHVVPPLEPGAYVLELDLVHEHVRWFGRGISLSVEVRPRERVAVIDHAARIPEIVSELRLNPTAEVVVVLRDPADGTRYADYDTTTGLRAYLLDDTESKGRIATLARLVPRTAKVALAARRQRPTRPSFAAFLDSRVSTSSLVVGGPNWAPDAAFGREWWVLATTALAWRLARLPVVVRKDALPGGRGVRDVVVRWVFRRLASS